MTEETIDYYDKMNDIEREIRTDKPKSLVDPGFNCMIPTCPIKKEKNQVRDRVKIYEDIVKKKQGSIEHFEDLCKDTLTEEKCVLIYKDILKDKEVNSLKKYSDNTKKENEILKADNLNLGVEVRVF